MSYPPLSRVWPRSWFLRAHHAVRCMERKLTDASRLSLRSPEVAADWHPTKNGTLTPHDVAYASHIKRWWVCKRGKDHEWDESPARRTSGRRCPFCAGKRVADSNRLSTNYPRLVPEWHPTRNGDLTPDKVTSWSNKKVWWGCDIGRDHEWDDTPAHRAAGRGCPFCAGKRVADSNRLSTNYPRLVPEWHPTRNGDLTPDKVTSGSNKKVWWRCDIGADHQWKAPPSHRAAGSGCPFCAGKRVADSNRLSTNYPQLVPEWHPTKNDDLTPNKVTSGSSLKVWWLCESGHEWDAVVASRVAGGHGCPYCVGKRPTDANRLSILFPDVANEWHPTKNGVLTPHDVSYGSNKSCWWQCEAGHEWKTRVCYRTFDGTGCPYCAGKRITDANRLSTQYPELVEEWHPTKNGKLTPGDVHYSSNKKVWWRCDIGADHEWEAPPSHRTSGSGCPFCAGRAVADSNRLSTNHPGLVPEWHPTRNGEWTPDKVTSGSSRKVWWLCENGHAWDAVVVSRVTGGHRCSYCTGRRVSDANRLSIKYPDVAKEWHPTKNDDLTPDEVAVASNKKAWWICDKGHEWEAVIPSRTIGGTGCPYCAGLLVSDANRLSIKFPDVAKEWHPTKNNGLTPDDVSYGSEKKLWWLCERGHEWDATAWTRVGIGAGCPYCSGLRVSDDNRLSLRNPELVKEWHPTKNNGLTPDDVSFGSGLRVWWVCGRGHEWEAGISGRANGSGCRSCSLPHRSYVEIYLACELATFFGDIDPTRTHNVSTPDGMSMDVDILIESQNLVIEYDGRHWHEDTLTRDIQKTDMLQSAGWNVLRIREDPLELVLSSDLRCPPTFLKTNAIKNLTERVLIHLKNGIGIEVPGVDEYLESKSLANKATADDIAGRKLPTG